MISSSTAAVSAYQNSILLKERSGWQEIARVDHDIDWKFEVDFYREAGMDKGVIQIGSPTGPTDTPLTGGIQTIKGTGRVVRFSWERAKGNTVNLRANPFGTNTIDPWPITTLAYEPNTCSLQLGAAMTGSVQWKLDIFVDLPDGSSAERMQLVAKHTVRLGILQEGPNSFSNLAAETISVLISGLKGTMKLGYTLTETEPE
ncbi:MAG TPA: hypothetical protein VF525_02105 [Pyrinomonadaceae bacterium]|jgi:hypothetical protein